MSRAVDDLLQILDLERLEINLFRGNSPQVGWQRVFGGQVIGQALVAACRTVEGREPHSLHAYFLLGGDPKVPIIYEVDRIRDGRSFTTRRVIAIQHGQPIFSMSVSFHLREPGLEYAVPMPKVPGPEELPSEAEIKATVMPMMPDPVRAYYEREQWDDGNNTLAIGPRLAVAYERNVETNLRLEDAGIEVVRIAGSELGSGRGGPRCMSCPISREPLA